MTNKFNPHDIVTDGQFEFRVYKALELGTETPAYDVVTMSGKYDHTVRSENELTMVRKYVKTEWNETLQQWVTK